MKLAGEHIDLHSVGIQHQVQFKIASNPKMFKLLSDSLYSNKVASVIRELSTNSLDSHISVGKANEPFSVHLPCQSNPIFSVRDYGSGLSYEQLINIYTTYGESNRSESNDYTGMMGLGSKSPFCLTDSFTTTSYYNGKKYLCITGRNDNGPTLNVMDEQPTDEPNGVEVSVSVKREYFNQFLEESKKIYKYFPVLPKVSGYAQSVKLPEQEIVLQGSGWRLLGGSRDNSVAIMGSVGYPIEVSHFSKHVDSNGTWYGRYHSNYDNFEAELLKLGLEIFFPVGAIENSISREAIQYNTTSISEIKRRLVEIGEEIKLLVGEHFKACTSLWEARCLYQDLFVRGNLRNLSHVAQIVGTTWQGQDITKQIYINTGEDYNLDMVSVTNGKSSTRRRTSHYINAYKETKFYLNDLKKGAYATAERDTQDGKHCVWLLTFKGTDEEMKEAKEYFIKTVGITESQLVYVSTLPQATKAGYAGSRKTKQFEFVNKNTSGYRSSRRQDNWWKEVTIDLEQGGYYVRLSGFKIAGPTDEMEASDLGRLLTNAADLGIKVPPVINGIRPSHVEKIKEDNDWINLFDYLLEQLKVYAQKNNYVAAIEELTQFSSLNETRYDDLAKLRSSIDITKPMGVFLENFARIQKMQNTMEDKISPLTHLSSSLGYTLPKSVVVFDLLTEEKKLNQTYPMFKLADNYRFDKEQAKTVITYINLVDSQ